MTLVRAGLLGLLAGVVGAVLFGLGATLAVESVGAVRDGGSGQASVMIFGPIGFLAGGLLGASRAWQGSGADGGSARLARRASMIIALIGVVLCLVNVVHARTLS